MKIILLALALTLFAPLAGPGTVAVSEIPVDAGNWAPPDLSQANSAMGPWLLVLKIAQEEIGYTEGPRSDETKYGLWYGDARCAWCAEFLSWCVNEADLRHGTSLLGNIYPRYGKQREGVPFFIREGRFISDTGQLPTHELQWLAGDNGYLQKDGYVPKPGDYLWIYYYARPQGPDHVAIVEGVSRGPDGAVCVHVIEGNNPDSVRRNSYMLDDWRIYGFGTPEKRAYSNIRLHSTGKDVLELRRLLAQLGYLDSQAAVSGGSADAALMDAVERFQRDRGLRPTRAADRETMLALMAEAPSP